MDLTITIVNTSNIAFVAPCLDSIREQTRGIDYEVIVVDNASTDDSLEILKRDYPWVQLIESDELQGFSTNHNMAIARAKGRHICVFNDDTVVINNLMAEMVRFLDEHADFGAVGPKFIYPDGSYQMGPRGKLSVLTCGFWELKLDKIFPRSRTFGQFFMPYWDPDVPCEMETAMGACITVRREVIDQVGPLEERIFFGTEDLEWSYRIRKGGWRIWYMGDQPLIHHGSVTIRRDLPRILERLYKGFFWFFDRHFGWGHANAYRFFAAAGALIRGIGWGAVGLIKPSERERAEQEVRARWAVFKLSLSPRLKQIVEAEARG